VAIFGRNKRPFLAAHVAIFGRSNNIENNKRKYSFENSYFPYSEKVQVKH